MSGTYPITVGSIPRISYSSVHGTVLKAKSLSGREYRAKTGGHSHLITLNYDTNLPRADLAQIAGFLESQEGGFSTFTITPPDKSTPRGSFTPGNALVAAASQTGTSLYVYGFPTSTSGVLLAGDILKVNDHAKVYTITADVNSDALGEATMSISPALIASPPINDPVLFTNVSYTVRLLNDNLDHVVSAPLLYGLTVELIEVY